jgi:hypothetical protein
MKKDLVDGLKEIFKYREMLKDVIEASMNRPKDYVSQVFPIYEEIVELVDYLKFDIKDLNNFLANDVLKYGQQPFFPVLAGLYINALINKLFIEYGAIEINIEKLCYGIVDDAAVNASAQGDTDENDGVSFSLDFLGYLLPIEKTLVIKGPVGDYCGALMSRRSTLVLLTGMKGKHFTYEKDPTSMVVIH